MEQILYDRISAALVVVESYGSVDEAHHKQWIIDQMVRALLTSDQYDDWVQQYNGNEEATDTWDVGIAP